MIMSTSDKNKLDKSMNRDEVFYELLKSKTNCSRWRT